MCVCQSVWAYPLTLGAGFVCATGGVGVTGSWRAGAEERVGVGRVTCALCSDFFSEEDMIIVLVC